MTLAQTVAARRNRDESYYSNTQTSTAALLNQVNAAYNPDQYNGQTLSTTIPQTTSAALAAVNSVSTTPPVQATTPSSSSSGSGRRNSGGSSGGSSAPNNFINTQPQSSLENVTSTPMQESIIAKPTPINSLGSSSLAGNIVSANLLNINKSTYTGAQPKQTLLGQLKEDITPQKVTTKTPIANTYTLKQGMSPVMQGSLEQAYKEESTYTKPKYPAVSETIGFLQAVKSGTQRSFFNMPTETITIKDKEKRKEAFRVIGANYINNADFYFNSKEAKQNFVSSAGIGAGFKIAGTFLSKGASAIATPAFALAGTGKLVYDTYKMQKQNSILSKGKTTQEKLEILGGSQGRADASLVTSLAGFGVIEGGSKVGFYGAQKLFPVKQVDAGFNVPETFYKPRSAVDIFERRMTGNTGGVDVSYKYSGTSDLAFNQKPSQNPLFKRMAETRGFNPFSNKKGSAGSLFDIGNEPASPLDKRFIPEYELGSQFKTDLEFNARTAEPAFKLPKYETRFSTDYESELIVPSFNTPLFKPMPSSFFFGTPLNQYKPSQTTKPTTLFNIGAGTGAGTKPFNLPNNKPTIDTGFTSVPLALTTPNTTPEALFTAEPETTTFTGFGAGAFETPRARPPTNPGFGLEFPMGGGGGFGRGLRKKKIKRGTSKSIFQQFFNVQVRKQGRRAEQTGLTLRG